MNVRPTGRKEINAVMFLAALAFAVAILMHLFGWSHGVVDVTLFTLAGLLCLALAGCTWGWLPRRPPPRS